MAWTVKQFKQEDFFSLTKGLKASYDSQLVIVVDVQYVFKY